jgi:hypothetical protein
MVPLERISSVYSVRLAFPLYSTADGTTFSSSVKANSALRPDWRLNDDEIIPKFGETTSVTNNNLSSSLMQDDHVRGPRNYGKNGQLLLTFQLFIHLNRSRS